MRAEADPLEAKAEEKGEEALGHKGEEPSVREDAYPLEAEAEENAEEAFEQRRELNALRHKMHKAVEEEDFETAIELRDMIRKMESLSSQILLITDTSLCFSSDLLPITSVS